MTTLKEHITGQTHFDEYRDGEFWYTTDSDFHYPVPLQDIGAGRMQRVEKAISHMRWIKRWMKVTTEGVN